MAAMETTAADGVVAWEGSFEHSATIGKIGLALSKAQGAMKGATKDATNPHFKTKYADLASCWEVARAPLAANELALLQMTEDGGPGVVPIVSMLVHSSGEYFRSRLPMPVPQATPQAVGSAITYGRRYGMCAILGIAPEDDDGETAQRSPIANARPAAPQVQPSNRTQSQAAHDMEQLMGQSKTLAELQDVWGTIVKMPFREAARAELTKTFEAIRDKFIAEKPGAA